MEEGWDGGPSTLLASCLSTCRSGGGISLSDPCVPQPPADLAFCLCQGTIDPGGAHCAVVESFIRGYSKDLI